MGGVVKISCKRKGTVENLEEDFFILMVCCSNQSFMGKPPNPLHAVLVNILNKYRI